MNVLETIESNSFCNGSLQCCVIGNEIVSVTNSRYLPNHALYHDRVTTTNQPRSTRALCKQSNDRYLYVTQAVAVLLTDFVIVNKTVGRFL